MRSLIIVSTLFFSASGFGQFGFPGAWGQFPGGANGQFPGGAGAPGGANSQFPGNNFKPPQFGFGGLGQMTNFGFPQQKPQTPGQTPNQTPGQTPGGGFPGFNFGSLFGQMKPTSPVMPVVAPEVVQPSPDQPPASELSDEDEMKLIAEIFTQTPPEEGAVTPSATVDDSAFSPDCEACYDVDERVQENQ